MSKGKIALLVIGSIVGLVLLYVVVCCGVTFVPMIKMAAINNTAKGESTTPAESVALPSGATLYAFPVQGGKDKYVVICPGGGYVTCEVEAEGYCVAAEFNRLGYTAFVLEYRVGKAISTYRAPLDDLAAAVSYIDANAARWGVTAGRYDLCGFSAGGNLVGLFGTTHCGYALYEGVQKPETVIMGYPWLNPHLPDSYHGNAATGILAATFLDYKGNIADAFYYSNLTLGGANAFLGGTEHLEEMQVQHWVTPDYPRVYMMHGTTDVIVPVETASDLFADVLDKQGVDYRYLRPDGVGHGCGIGLGTPADGWIARAVAFANGEE